MSCDTRTNRTWRVSSMGICVALRAKAACLNHIVVTSIASPRVTRCGCLPPSNVQKLSYTSRVVHLQQQLPTSWYGLYMFVCRTQLRVPPHAPHHIHHIHSIHYSVTCSAMQATQSLPPHLQSRFSMPFVLLPHTPRFSMHCKTYKQGPSSGWHPLEPPLWVWGTAMGPCCSCSWGHSAHHCMMLRL